MIAVTKEEPHCPFCKEELDNYCGDYPCHCKCGCWYTEDFSFKRTQLTPAEEEADRQKSQVAANKHAARQRENDLKTYRRVKAELESNAKT